MDVQTRGGFAGILDQLSQPLGEGVILKRDGWRDRNTGEMHQLDYIEWSTAADLLDTYAPEWAHKIVDIRELGNYLVTTVAITIAGITREGVGVGEISDGEMGIKASEHDALKRAAVKFGVARELYRKGDNGNNSPNHTNGNGQRNFESKSPDQIDQPIAQNLGDLVSAKQLGMVRALARELRIDADEECNAVFNCRSDELSKAAASSFIKHLQDMQRPQETPAQERKPLSPTEPPLETDREQIKKANEALFMPGERKPAQASQQRNYGPATKPAKGGVGNGDRVASVKQLGFLSKIAVAIGDSTSEPFTVETLIQKEFSDIRGASELSSKAASFLIDKYQGDAKLN